MRNINRHLTVAALALAVIVGSSGCAALFGGHAQEHVLEPAISQAWEGVRADAVDGMSATEPSALDSQAQLRLAQWDEAIQAGDRDALKPLVARDWTAWRAWAEAGINGEPTDPEVLKASKRERLVRFAEALARL